jgi:hypothetical protein
MRSKKISGMSFVSTGAVVEVASVCGPTFGVNARALLLPGLHVAFNQDVLRGAGKRAAWPENG